MSIVRDGVKSPDFIHPQASALIRLKDAKAKQRLVANFAASLAQVTIPGVVDRSIRYLANADAVLCKRLRATLARLLRKK